jgi:hypothetical protein
MSEKLLPLPKTYIEKILRPISKLTESCVLKISEDNIYTICSPSDNSLILYAKAKLPLILETQKINIINIKKLLNGLDCLGDDGEFSFLISDNYIKCQSLDSNTGESTSFKYHLVDDGIIKESTINVQRIAKLSFDTEFQIFSDKIKKIMSAYSFATDAAKIYFYSKEGKIYGEVNDKTLQNIDNLSLLISDKVQGCDITSPMPISIEIFKNFILTNNPLSVKINNEHNVFVFQANIDENIEFKYIVSALVK